MATQKSGETPPGDDVYAYWEQKAVAVLTAEMRARKITYKDLSRRLEAFGIDELPEQLNRKVNRKSYSAAFLLACLAAMDVSYVIVPKGARTMPK